MLDGLLRLGVPWGEGLAEDAGLLWPVLAWMAAEGAPVGDGWAAEAEESGVEAT